MDSMLQTAVGSRLAPIVGATEQGDFFSLDGQAGRPAALLVLAGRTPHEAKALLDALDGAKSAFQEAGVDLIPLAPPDPAFAMAFAGDETRRRQVVYVTGGFGAADGRIGQDASALLIDRTGRLVERVAVSSPADLVGAVERAAPRLATETARPCASAAPVLILPNLLTQAQCGALIDHFEASDHNAGVMAAATPDGQAYAKLDESKKRRRELELSPEHPLGRQILQLLAEQVVPEIKRAFQADIAHADRILVARYDDDGGYFKRHRDNGAPHVAFREFAISLNLNTQDYEGGEILFPEFNDHRYSPPAGAAILFSASLLHEAAPVTRGSRYVVLSFLSSAAAMQRMSAA